MQRFFFFFLSSWVFLFRFRRRCGLFFNLVVFDLRFSITPIPGSRIRRHQVAEIIFSLKEEGKKWLLFGMDLKDPINCIQLIFTLNQNCKHDISE